MKPLEITRIGTVQDPIPIYSLVSLACRTWFRCCGVEGRGRVVIYGRSLEMFLPLLRIMDPGQVS
jgi:hypothetical protein